MICEVLSLQRGVVVGGRRWSVLLIFIILFGVESSHEFDAANPGVCGSMICFASKNDEEHSSLTAAHGNRKATATSPPGY